MATPATKSGHQSEAIAHAWDRLPALSLQGAPGCLSSRPRASPVACPCSPSVAVACLELVKTPDTSMTISCLQEGFIGLYGAHSLICCRYGRCAVCIGPQPMFAYCAASDPPIRSQNAALF